MLIALVITCIMLDAGRELWHTAASGLVMSVIDWVRFGLLR